MPVKYGVPETAQAFACPNQAYTALPHRFMHGMRAPRNDERAMEGDAHIYEFFELEYPVL
jgi:hypothetical protein